MAVQERDRDVTVMSYRISLQCKSCKPVCRNNEFLLELLEGHEKASEEVIQGGYSSLSCTFEKNTLLLIKNVALFQNEFENDG